MVKPEGAERGGGGGSARGLGAEDGDRLVDVLDVVTRPGRAVGVGRNVAAALVEAKSGVALTVVVRSGDRHRRNRAVF